MSPFRSTFAVQKQTVLPQSVRREDVLRLLHDHSVMITLNPIVINHDKVPGPISPPPSPKHEEAALIHDDDDISTSTTSVKYTITDRISYLPGHLWDSTITYSAWFVDTPDGVRSFVQAPAGVEIRGSWRVRPVQAVDERDKVDFGIYLIEEAIVSCNALLRPFIQSTMQKSHATLHQKLLETLVDGQRHTQS